MMDLGRTVARGTCKELPSDLRATPVVIKTEVTPSVVTEVTPKIRESLSSVVGKSRGVLSGVVQNLRSTRVHVGAVPVVAPTVASTLQSENKGLRVENTELRVENHELRTENGELRTENGILRKSNEAYASEFEGGVMSELETVEGRVTQRIR